MNTKLVVANWKSNKTLSEAIEWAQEFEKQEKKANRQYVVCPPFPLIPFVLDLIKQGVSLGTQNLSPYGAGAYTGEVSAINLKDLGITHTILGHSERRKYFQESSATVAQKVTQALDFGIQPIVCVDRDQIEEQAQALTAEQKKQIIVAYEPVHAISTFGGKEDPIEETIQVIDQIRDTFGEESVVLYGGSVNLENSIVYLENDNIDGALVGGASLQTTVFAQL
jgi:triosephosphate isomerase